MADQAIDNVTDNTSKESTTGTPTNTEKQDDNVNSLLDDGGNNTQESQSEDNNDKNNNEETSNEDAPEAYEDYTAPEGVTFNDEILGSFNETAKELNLTQEQAQKLVDIAIKNQSQSLDQQKQQWQNVFTGWNKEIKNDAEFGGINLPDTISRYKRSMATHGTPELKELLIQSGYEHHPAMIKHFAGLDKKYGEDKSVDGQAVNNKDLSMAEIMFGKNS